MRSYRFTRSPRAIRRQSVKLDNVVLVPGNLLSVAEAEGQTDRDYLCHTLLITEPSLGLLMSLRIALHVPVDYVRDSVIQDF